MTDKPGKQLELDDDDRFQRRSWRVERIGWACMSLVILATLAGALGPGLFGERALEEQGGFRIRYDRFVRYEAPATIYLDIPADENGKAEFWIAQTWLESVHLENVNPEPERVVTRGERVHYAIAAEPRKRVRATLHYESGTVGAIQGSAGQSDDSGLPLEQFAYP